VINISLCIIIYHYAIFILKVTSCFFAKIKFKKMWLHLVCILYSNYYMWEVMARKIIYNNTYTVLITFQTLLWRCYSWCVCNTLHAKSIERQNDEPLFVACFSVSTKLWGCCTWLKNHVWLSSQTRRNTTDYSHVKIESFCLRLGYAPEYYYSFTE